MSAATTSGGARGGALYRQVWRWHFYAGLFCIPFILWLATTGSLYLFKPQIEAWQERAYDRLDIHGPTAAPSAQVAAALAAVPGGVFNAYELPRTPHSAARVLVGRDGELTRVYLHPQTLAVLGQVAEKDRLMRTIFRLHGELLLGERGSNLVELAASWAIVMILTGLYLWWPRDAGLAGVVYPRLVRGGRRRWRDLHAVTGFWVSAFALFLLVSGLPWTQFWGGNLEAVRQWMKPQAASQDWFTSNAEERARIASQNAPPASPQPHAGHGVASGTQAIDLAALNRLVPVAVSLGLEPPVLLAPPSRATGAWSARSETQNRPLRARVWLEADGALGKRETFADKPLLDRVIGIGVAAHEGQLFGWPNQALGLFTALGLITLALSAAVMWWRRRPAGVLGAPAPGAKSGRALVVLVLTLGLLLPLLGLSLLLVFALERALLRHLRGPRRFLGLQAQGGPPGPGLVPCSRDGGE